MQSICKEKTSGGKGEIILWLDPADARTYQNLAEYMSRRIPIVYTVPSIAYALRELGQYNRTRLRQSLRWGHGPTVVVRDLIGANGEFTPDIQSNEIRVNRRLVETFEAGGGVERARAGNVYVIGTTLLHELVHWCDDKDGIDYPGEEGKEFEQLVYGRDIG